MITIFTFAYNESVIMKFFIDHYRQKFPSCNIVVIDNQSTDQTAKIALDNGCEVLSFDSGGELDDVLLRDIKNNCWRNSKTSWVLVCDTDELLDINEEQLKKEDSIGITIIKSEGYTMTNLEDNYDLSNIKYGIRDIQYDKAYLFNKNYIDNINYVPGAHSCDPEGVISISETAYKCYHMRYINPDLTIARYKLTAERLSERNKKYGCGDYVLAAEKDIRQEFENRRAIGIKVIE